MTRPKLPVTQPKLHQVEVEQKRSLNRSHSRPSPSHREFKRGNMSFNLSRLEWKRRRWSLDLSRTCLDPSWLEWSSFAHDSAWAKPDLARVADTNREPGLGSYIAQPKFLHRSYICSSYNGSFSRKLDPNFNGCNLGDVWPICDPTHTDDEPCSGPTCIVIGFDWGDWPFLIL